jgi:NADH:ubiquinone oxidoreductase subunit 6 (subunit J)
MGLDIAFWIMAIIVVVAALAVVFLRNVFCFITVAGLYVTLSADFLAAIQILVYVGAISVLIILAIMMTRDVQQGSPSNRMKLPAFIVAAVVLGIMIYTVTSTAWQVSTEEPLTPTTAPLALKLFSENGFILPVEIAAMLILAAIIGAIVIAREK